MTGQAMARLSGVTADIGPAPGSAWQPPRPGVPTVPPRRRRRKRPGPDARQRAEQGMVLLPPAGRRQGRLLRPGDSMTRPREVSQLTTAKLETARRLLRANLGMITPDS